MQSESLAQFLAVTPGQAVVVAEVVAVAVVEVDAAVVEPADTSTTPLLAIYTIWLREPVRATSRQTPRKICRPRLRASPTNYDGNTASATIRKTRVKRDSVVRLRCA